MIENILPWIPAIVLLLGIAKWLVGAASDLTKAISKLCSRMESLDSSFSTFKTDAKKEHEETKNRLDDHESRIHTLEDWKKFKDGDN